MGRGCSLLDYLVLIPIIWFQCPTAYHDKFENVQATMSKSSELFGSFKSEMDKMAKQTKQTQKEKLGQC